MVFYRFDGFCESDHSFAFYVQSLLIFSEFIIFYSSMGVTVFFLVFLLVLSSNCLQTYTKNYVADRLSHTFGSVYALGLLKVGDVVEVRVTFPQL